MLRHYALTNKGHDTRLGGRQRIEFRREKFATLPSTFCVMAPKVPKPTSTIGLAIKSHGELRQPMTIRIPLDRHVALFSGR
jgi:hypothetical protein